MRRHLLPAILVVVAVTGATAAWRGPAASQARPEQPGAAGGPLLTARRVPTLVVRPLGQRRLAAALGELVARSPATCLLVTDGARVLYEHRPDEPFLPASGMKLLTAAAVLARIPAEDRFRTTAFTAAPLDGGVLAGDLHLVGAGDPVLGTADYFGHLRRQPQLYTPLEHLADGLVAAGVRQVQGRVVGDGGRYDSNRYVASWRPVYIADNETGPLGALTVNDGFLAWEPRLRPAGDPAVGAAAALTTLLRQRGVAVHGEPAAGPAPADARELAAVASPPVGEIVADMIRNSDNGTAELLLKELGHRVLGDGSTTAGADAALAALADAGIPIDGVQIVDGSGLDRANRATCRVLHAVLARSPAGSPVDAGLAVAAESGTLDGRFHGSPVAGRLQAKTGSIRGVGTLAGHLDTVPGTRLTFAHIVNGVATYGAGLSLQDDLAAALVRYPELPPLAAVGPTAHPVTDPTAHSVTDPTAHPVTAGAP